MSVWGGCGWGDEIKPSWRNRPKWWKEISAHFLDVETWAFVIMPNHIHGIVVITGRRGTVPVPDEDQINNFNEQQGKEAFQSGEMTSQRGEMTPQRGEMTPQRGEMTSPLRTPTLGQIVAYFKYQSTKEMNALGGDTIAKFWQRNYYERIIRNEKEMDNIWKYIEANPSMWANDDENPLKAR
jgi:putative transposase